MIIHFYTKADDYNHVSILDNMSETEIYLIRYIILLIIYVSIMHSHCLVFWSQPTSRQWEHKKQIIW